MGCGPSSEQSNLAESQEQKPQQTGKAQDAKKPLKSVVFEVSADELKVPSNKPAFIRNAEDKTPEDTKDNARLAAELKEKEEQAEQNRLAELSRVQLKAKADQDRAKEVRDRKKAILDETNGRNQFNLNSQLLLDQKDGASSSKLPKLKKKL
ncbi:hypothetical protein MP228_001043 [Amoeboaphelidium protococcarum]|nr:hypothetical protein MP228_001043 [Amoeboaphelidium protococcarum]